MKKTILALIVLITIALLGIEPAVSAKDKDEPQDLEKIEIIHYKKDLERTNNGRGTKQPACYGFLTKTKVKWPEATSYVINPLNSHGLSLKFVETAISSAAETWDSATGFELLLDNYGVDESVNYGVRDYKNAIVFGNYPTSGVIAVTSIWYSKATGRIYEFDILFDDDFSWGDATVDTALMDLQNIATHELGHGIGLGDIYNLTCSEVTMYGYSAEGETDKTTLETPDIKGLQTLYGI